MVIPWFKFFHSVGSSCNLINCMLLQVLISIRNQYDKWTRTTLLPYKNKTNILTCNINTQTLQIKDPNTYFQKVQCFHCDFASADLIYMERTHLVILDWPICNFSNSHHLGKDILHVSAKYWQCRFLNELPSPTLPSKLQLQIQCTVVNFDYLLSKISLLQCSIIKTAGA